MSITTIIFDLDETLITDDEATAQALARVGASAHAEHGLDSTQLQEAVSYHAKCLWHDAPTYDYCHMIGISASEGLWGRFAGTHPQLQALHSWVPDYQRTSWWHGLAEQGMEDEALAKRLANMFAQERRACQAIFPEVEAHLQALRADYRLAILTNGAPDLQREKIESLKLGHYFDAIVVSGEVGVGKPHPNVFKAVLNQLAISPEQAVMVGDNLRRDVAGAHQLGMRGIWINRCKVACDPTYAAQVAAEITDLSELRQAL